MVDKDLYKNILKSNTLFGSIKIFQIVVTLVRAKIVALILGPTGIGMQSLFTSTLDSLQQFTTLGIFQSSIRDISQANTKQNDDKVRIINVVRTLVLIVAVFGGLICCGFSNVLSNVVFGRKDYTIAFVIISVALVFQSFSNGFIAIFQGLRKLSELAKGSLIGAIISIILSTPLYYLWGISAIPYAIVVGHLAVFLVYRFYAGKISILKTVHFATYNELINLGGPIVKLGFILMLSNGIMTLFSLALNAFINRLGGTTEVGYFSAAITCTYGNIIILTSILSSDYYPQLSASIKDHSTINKIVNQQIELIILIVAPLICLIIPFAYIVVILLYSKEFIIIIPMIQIMSISLIFKVLWHALSFIILANGDRKTYLIYDAIIGNGLVFLLNLLGYQQLGLNGLSISFVIGSIIMVGILYSIITVRYHIKLSKEFWLIFAFMLIMCLISYTASLLIHNRLIMWAVEISAFFLAIGMTVYILDKRIDLIVKIKSLFSTYRRA